MKFLGHTQEFFKKTARVLRYFRPYWRIWACLYVVAFFYTVLALANPLITKLLIDDVLVNKNEQMLVMLMWVFAAVNVLAVIVQIITAYMHQKFKSLILFDVRNDLFRHLETLDVEFFARHKLGDMLTRLTDDVDGIETFVSLFFNTLVLNIFFAVVTLAIAFTLNWQLTLAALVVVPFVVMTQKHYGKVLRDYYGRIAVASSDYLSYLAERLSAMPEVKGFVREGYELERQKKKALHVIDIALKATLTQSISSGVAGLLVFLSLLYVTWEGSHLVFSGVMTIGTLVALSTYINGLFGPVRALTDLNVSFQTTMVYVGRVFAILDMKPRISEKPGATELKAVKGRITFRNVSFTHETRKEHTVENLNLEIRPGKIVGLVGPSGCGKSTLAHLLVRFYDPERGRVLLDGTDVRDARLDSLRQHIGIVPQEAVLFNANVRENIAYGKPHASHEEIENAARLADIHDFIISLPHGYETSVGEHGLTFSGGQMQRIAIARILLKDPEVIILDEATSFLDGKNESEILGIMHKLARKKTIIIITHRVSSLKDVDRIFVFCGGKVVEQGSFSHLAKEGAMFRKLYIKRKA